MKEGLYGMPDDPFDIHMSPPVYMLQWQFDFLKKMYPSADFDAMFENGHIVIVEKKQE